MTYREILTYFVVRWDEFPDSRDDYVGSSVALDYNAGLQTLAAGILELQVKLILRQKCWKIKLSNYELADRLFIFMLKAHISII